MEEMTENFEELKIKYERLYAYSKLLELALDTVLTLNKTLREVNEEFRTKLNNI